MNEQQDGSLGNASSNLLINFFKILFFAMFGAFSITIATFLRHDFGERYYSLGKFIGGLLLLYTLTMMGAFGVLANDNSVSEWWIAFVVIGYVIFSAFHMWKIWVNKQIGEPRHSYDNGISHLLPLARYILKFNNPVLNFLVSTIGKTTLNNDNYQRLKHSLEFSPAIKDPDRFTKLWLEPILGILIGMLTSGALSFWLFTSSIALFIHSYMIYSRYYNEGLDLVDSMIKAADQKDNTDTRNALKHQMRGAIEAIQKKVDKEPEYEEILKKDSPDVFQALAELNIDLKGASNNSN